jgi:hypothetical protein
MQPDDNFDKPEKLLTFQEAADLVGAKPWQIRRAVNRGLIPYYQPFNSRKLVRLSDVVAVIEASRKGGE